MVKNKDIIDVIHEKDLEEFLTNTSLYEDFKKEKINCRYCEKTIYQHNICGIFINMGEIKFICNDESCYEKLISYHGGENID